MSNTQPAKSCEIIKVSCVMTIGGFESSAKHVWQKCSGAAEYSEPETVLVNGNPAPAVFCGGRLCIRMPVNA